jgi:hypothetical protein
MRVHLRGMHEAALILAQQGTGGPDLSKRWHVRCGDSFDEVCMQHRTWVKSGSRCCVNLVHPPELAYGC